MFLEEALKQPTIWATFVTKLHNLVTLIVYCISCIDSHTTLRRALEEKQVDHYEISSPFN